MNCMLSGTLSISRYFYSKALLLPLINGRSCTHVLITRDSESVASLLTCDLRETLIANFFIIRSTLLSFIYETSILLHTATPLSLYVYFTAILQKQEKRYLSKSARFSGSHVRYFIMLRESRGDYGR